MSKNVRGTPSKKGPPHWDVIQDSLSISWIPLFGTAAPSQHQHRGRRHQKGYHDDAEICNAGVRAVRFGGTIRLGGIVRVDSRGFADDNRTIRGDGCLLYTSIQTVTQAGTAKKDLVFYYDKLTAKQTDFNLSLIHI